MPGRERHSTFVLQRQPGTQIVTHTPESLAQVNMRRYNVVCGPGQCEYQEGAAGTAQNWELQKNPNPQLVEVKFCHTS